MNSHADLPSADVQEYWSTKAAPRFSLFDHLSTQSCAQELTAARHAIDDELSALQMTIHAMRTRRNSFSLIERLPPEILSCIFSFHAINQPAQRDPIYNPDDPFPLRSGRIRLGLGWITVTHICRHWRQVALSDPDLWRTIVFDLGAEWAEEVLARSKAALISYIRDLSFPPKVSRRRFIDDEATLRKHLSHVGRLVLSGNPKSLAPTMRALTTPAPRLKSLEVVQDRLHLRESCITLPSDLFAHDAPNLCHVTLFGWVVPWDSPLLRDLTHLDIRIPYPGLAPAAQSNLLSIPTLERLLSILETMPSLQVLALHNCLPRPESTSRAIPLRHVSKLSLEGYLSEALAVLKRVSLPSSASLSLHCHDRTPPGGLLDTLVSLLASHFQAPETSISPLSTMVIGQNNHARLSIMVWDTDAPLHPPKFVPSAPTRLSLRFSLAPVESVPLRVCKALPLRDLHILSITYPEALWSVGDWVDVCSHCPKVTDLHVRDSLARALTPTLKNCNAFPSLVTLTLQDVNFSASLPEYTEPLGVVLPVNLRARRDAGIPVRRVKLYLTIFGFDGTLMESLKEVVNDVACDYLDEKED